MTTNNQAPIPMSVDAAEVAKLSPESQASLRDSYRTAGRTPAEIDAAFGVKPNAGPPTVESETEKLRLSLGMTPEAFRENQQRQGINPNDAAKAMATLDRPELSAPVNAGDYKLPFGQIPEGKPIKEALAERAVIQAAFKAGDIPQFSAGAIFEALNQSAATIAQITNPLARSLHNQHEKVTLGHIYPQGADAAMKSAAIVLAKMPAEQVKAWRDSGALDSARVVALLARVGEIATAREAKKAKAK